MLGFAVVDHQAGASNGAVWLTSRTGAYSCGHTNAVSLDLADPKFAAKVHSLTRDRIVVLTSGSVADGLPIAGWITVDEIDLLGAETDAHQERISQAVALARIANKKKRKLVEPDFMGAPPRPERWGETSVERALGTAAYVSRAWGRWLATEEQRCRRVDSIMPEPLSSPDVAELPEALQERWAVQKLEPFHA